MDILRYVLLILIVGGGAFVQRVTGFGLGIFGMLFLPYFMPSPAAAAILSIVSIVSSCYNAVRHHRQIQWRTMMPLLISSLAVIPVAVWLTDYLPQKTLKQILGVVLMILSVYFLFFSKRLHIRPTTTNGVLAGTLGGLLNGMFSTGGPPIVVYLIHAAPDNLTYFATIQAYFAATNAFSTVSRAMNGLITAEVLLMSLLGMAGMLLGNGIGGKIFEKLNADRLRLLVYIGMLISGLLMIF